MYVGTPKTVRYTPRKKAIGRYTLSLSSSYYETLAIEIEIKIKLIFVLLSSLYYGTATGTYIRVAMYTYPITITYL